MELKDFKSLKFSDDKFSGSEKEVLWKKIEGIIAESEAGKKHLYLRPLLKIAAVICVIISTSLIFYYLNSSDNTTQIVVECQKGRKMEVDLPDGSIVMLNSDSRVSYASKFKGDYREVKLEGEGYFNVVSNPDKPFIVHTEKIKTSVLGTTFNIKSYKEENQIEVVVESGTVSVSRFKEGPGEIIPEDQGADLILNRNEKVIFDKSSNNFSAVKSALVKDLIAWKSWVLVFENATCEEIINSVERWYAVEFIVEENATIPSGFTGKFHNTSLNRVLNAISYTSKCEFEIVGDKVLVKSVSTDD